LFNPPVLPAPMSAAQALSSEFIDEGIALHALLERLTYAHSWPPQLPEAAAIAAWLQCELGLAETVRAQAGTILSSAELRRFFDPSTFRFARNEMEIVTADGVLRFDRIVMFEDALWILDYKRQLLESERIGYAQQLARYRAAAREVFIGVEIRSALITSDGNLIEIH
ncbi:MAG TPA: PD-(D/E)XK nuclease family protein, partial [Oxalicibacterium sp.]|nr:PD-(D/E)XK nuclease family protein [Oxalicibacterium sp.]